MKVGDLVKNIHTGGFHIITSVLEAAYYEVDYDLLYPEEHLEVINENR